MRIKNYGLMFEFVPAQESDRKEIAMTNEYVTQECRNFVLVNYFKGEKKNVAFNDEGFQTTNKIMYIEMFMVDDTNPRKMIYDKKDDCFYRILDTPIEQSFDPSKRKLYRLPIEYITDSDLRFNSTFIRNKFDELWRVLNGSL